MFRKLTGMVVGLLFLTATPTNVLAAQQDTVSDSEKNYFDLIVSILAITFGVLCIFMALIRGYQGRSSLKWPSVTGTVRHANVIEEEEEGGVRFRVDLAYRYISYEGNNIWFGIDTSFGSYADAKRLIIDLKSGQPIEVYYNPKNPEISALVPGLRAGLMKPLLFGAALIGFGIFGLSLGV